MTNILVTGGTGFIGRNMLPLLREQEPSATIYALSSKTAHELGNTLPKGVEAVSCDLLNAEQVASTVANIKPNKLIHLAWGMEPSNYNLPSNFEWLSASMQLIANFQQAGGQSMLIAGSCVQYDWQLGGCSEANTPRAVNNTYGHCKNILEDYALAFSEAHNMQCTWARPFFMYGPFEDDRRLLAYVIKNLVERKPATVQNGALLRDFMHCEDVASLMLALHQQSCHGVFNIGCGEMTSLGEAGQMAANIIGCPELLEIKVPENVSNKYVYAHTDKVSSTINWQPRYTMQSGLEQTINWWRNNV